MIARHSHEQTDAGEGVEVVENVACEDPEHGKGQYTEKRIHLSRYGIFINWSRFLCTLIAIAANVNAIYTCKNVNGNQKQFECVCNMV
jgi:hypothetical protein